MFFKTGIKSDFSNNLLKRVFKDPSDNIMPDIFLFFTFYTQILQDGCDEYKFTAFCFTPRCTFSLSGRRKSAWEGVFQQSA